MTLAGLDFMQRGENIIFTGPTGTGKSGSASGILRQALISGYRGRFYNVQNLLDELYASRADRSTPQLLMRLCRYDLLLLDELGYLTLTPEQMNSFFKLMKERYEAGRPTIITTNLAFEHWYDILKPKHDGRRVAGPPPASLLHNPYRWGISPHIIHSANLIFNPFRIALSHPFNTLLAAHSLAQFSLAEMAQILLASCPKPVS